MDDDDLRAWAERTVPTLTRVEWQGWRLVAEQARAGWPDGPPCGLQLRDARRAEALFAHLDECARELKGGAEEGGIL